MSAAFIIHFRQYRSYINQPWLSIDFVAFTAANVHPQLRLYLYNTSNILVFFAGCIVLRDMPFLEFIAGCISGKKTKQTNTFLFKYSYLCTYIWRNNISLVIAGSVGLAFGHPLDTVKVA